MTKGVYGLTPRTLDLLAFLRTYIGTYGVAPSYDEMAAAVGGGKGKIGDKLDQLEARGFIVRIDRTKRSIRLTDDQMFRLSADLTALLYADAAASGVTPEEHLRQAVHAFLRRGSYVREVA